jgi:uncharacterized protein YdeI (YjbR/CyaY-like superfamily)
MSGEEVLFFKNNQECLIWFKKNHKKTSAWFGFHKKGVDKKAFTMAQALEIAMGFGWTGNVIQSLDYLTYKVKFSARKPGSVWSPGNVKKFLELQQKGRVHPSGQKVFRQRDQEKSMRLEKKFSPSQVKKFKSHRKAWDFFNSQTPSYRKYMQNWVISAQKTETQERRLAELIKDSANGTKLKRILKAQEKYQKNGRRRFEPGKTPIEEGKNLGPVTSLELRSIGIETLEELKRLGWEQAFQKLVQLYPHRLHLNMVYALAGAVHELNWLKLDAEIKAECKMIYRELKF